MRLNDSTKRHAHNFKDLTGQRFGRWLVISPAETRKFTPYYLCQCDCGTQREVNGRNLVYGASRSCGCLSVDTSRTLNTTHGMFYSSEYHIWSNIRARCCNPKTKIYPYYGGRGITMCKQWLDSFESFYADMGPRPSPEHSIDRIDNEQGYSPDNCRWATRIEQASNKRNNVHITYQNETHTLAEWARLLGMKRLTLRARIFDFGWTIEQALTTPVRKSGTHEK